MELVPGSVELARRVVVRVLVERVLPGLARKVVARVLVERVLPGPAREVVAQVLVVLLQVLVQVARRVMAGRRAPQAQPIRTRVLLGRRALGRLEFREVLGRLELRELLQRWAVQALVQVPGGLPVQELGVHPRRE